MKKLSKIVLTVTMIASLATVMGCSKKEGTTNKSSSAVKYTDIELGKTDTDLTATIKMLTHRTWYVKRWIFRKNICSLLSRIQ